MARTRIHTSESVTDGHPDKVADQIADALLDEFLEQDPNARVAIECLLTRGLAVVAGEVTVDGYVEIPDVVRSTVTEIGYTDTDLGFDGNTCGVMVAIQGQSPDIAKGVDTGGAGDQGMMFGMACRDTPDLMPLPISIAHALSAQLSEVRRKHPSQGLRPDGKSQVSVVYEDGVPEYIQTIVVSAQHAPGMEKDAVESLVRSQVIDPVVKRYRQYDCATICVHINPTGIFTIGGPQADTGVTGRKIVVDTYGGMCPHGGGAFSGKDPTKVDRSAAYMARHVAKCIVAADLADRVELSLAYAIGKEQPVAVQLETFGTERESHDEIERRVRDVFDLSPKGIIEHLGLRKAKYLPTARNGHFGHASFPWERTHAADALKR